MTKVDIVKTGASWKGMVAILLVAVMVAMVAAPMIKAEAAPVTPPAESSIPEAPSESGAQGQDPNESPLKPQTPEVTEESKLGSKTLPLTAQQQDETLPDNVEGSPASEDTASYMIEETTEADADADNLPQLPERFSDVSSDLDYSVPQILESGHTGTPSSVPPNPQPNALTFFTNRPAFDTAYPGLPIEDFEEATIGAGNVDSIPAPLDEFSNNAYFNPGDILPGIQFQDTPLTPPDGLAILGAGFMGNPSINIVANYFVNSFEIVFTDNVNAVGMDLVSYVGSGTVNIEVFGPGSVSLGTTTATASNAGDFWGVFSDSDYIASIVISDTGSGAEGADNVAFGEITGSFLYEISPAYQYKYCSFNGEQVDYSLTLTNNGPTTEVFDLSAANNAWPTDFIYLGPSASQMQNPSFETGDFTGWLTSDLATPFSPLQVSGAGNDPWGTFFDSAPTDGAFSLQTGWDGDGPGHIMAGQDYAAPAIGETLLTFDYRAAWDLLYEVGPSAYGRTFSVNIEPAGGGVPLASNQIFTAEAATYNSDTGIMHGTVDLTPYAGTTVFINLDWWVPELYSGPAFFELDNVRVMTSSTALLLSEGFEGAFPPAGWTFIQNNVAETWHQETLSVHTGTYSATCYYDPALNPQDEWLITPPLDLRASTNTQLSFWWLMSYNWGVSPFDNYDLNVYISTDSWGTSTLLWNEDSMGAFSDWVWYDTSMGTPLDLSAYDGLDNVQIGFQYAGTDGAQLSLDDITVTATTSALGPVPPGGSMPFIARVTVPPGAVPGDFDVADITATPVQPLPLEQFEGAFPPAGWSVINYGGTHVWQRNDYYGTPNWAGTGFCADADSDAAGMGSVMNTGLRTPSFSLGGYSSAQLEFGMDYYIWSGNEYGDVRVSTDGGATWDVIAHYTTDLWGVHISLDLTAYVGNPSVIVEFLYGNANYDYSWEIDDVEVIGVPLASNTAQVETIWPNTFPWSDDMESSTAPWDTDGLWHLVDDLTSPYPNSYSPTHSWWYGQDATGDYDTGFRTFGRLETPPIDLTGVSEAVFSFVEWFDTEGSPWDQRWIQYNAGSGWFDIQQLPYDTWDTWIHRTIDLTPYCGQIIRLGFWFDTLDAGANDYPGWYVDDAYVGPYAVDLSPDYQTQSDYWSADVDYLLTVDNLGSLPDSYDLLAIGNPWPVTFWNAAGTSPITSTGTVPAHGSRNIIARVHIPYGTADGTLAFTQLMAISQNNPGFTWDRAWVTTIALNPFGVDLTPDFQTGTGYVSTSYDYTMTVQNTGVWTDRYDISVVGNVWPTTFWNMAGTTQIFQTPFIAPGATYNFIVRVDIPALAPPASSDLATVIVTSQGDPVWTTDSGQVQTFSDSPYGVMLLPDYQEHTGSTGHYVDHLLTVTNTGVWPETYDLTAVGNAWPVTFYGPVGEATTLLTEGFEGGVMPPVGWSVIDGVSSTQHWRTLDAATYPMYVHAGAYGGWVNYQMADQDEWLISPNMAIPGSGVNTILEFWAQSDTNFPGATMILYAAEAGGAYTDTLWNLIADESWGTFDFHLITIDLSAYAGQNIHLVWQYIGNDGESFGLDDIEVTSSVPIVPTGPITSIGPIPPGSSMNFIARVDIPMGLPPGSFDVATIVATCQDYFYTWDDAIIRTNGEPEYWFDVIPDTQTHFGWEGEWVEHRVQITNEGTMPDVYLPMFYEDTGNPAYDADWWTKFFTVDLRPQGIYNGIDDGSETWWWGPVQPGETKEYVIKVFVPTDDIGAFDQARIYITSDNEGTVVREVEIWTRLSMPAPFYDDFELAGNMGVFGLYNDPVLGWVYDTWTRTEDMSVGTWDGTPYTGTYSMYLGAGETATTCKINMEMPYGIASCVIRRGDVAFGSDNPESGEDLIVEYSDGNLQWAEWHVLGTFPGDGTPGEVLTPLWILPEDALNPRFQLRFREAAGDDNADYWHIDNVFIGAPESNFELQQFTPPAPTYTLMSDNFEDGDFSDWTSVGASNDWQIGTPPGLNGDPVGAYSGTYSIGNDLFGNGRYENNVPADQNYIYTPVINCQGYSHLTLEFYRWLGIENSVWDHAFIYVSIDGVTWSQVWSHTGSSFTDPAWTFTSYDIPSLADDQATVYIRFDMGPTDSSVTYCGWNIDNVRLTGQIIVTTETIMLDDFEDGDFSDWTRVGGSNDWEIGTPAGLGTPPDPIGAFAGTYSIGNDLTGLGTYPGEYENGLPAESNYIYSPAINCADYTDVTLEFHRWLGVESATFDHAYVYVSDDAVTWNQVWSHTGSSFTDGAWFHMNYDISTWADDEATVYIRFDMGPTDGSVTYCGWNIDNFYLSGTLESIDYAGPGEDKVYDVSIENLARHCDEYTISVQGNTWPTEVLIPALEDDFSDLNMDGWNIVDEGTLNTPSNWFVNAAGVLRQTGNIYAYPGQWLPGTFIWNGEKSWTDYTLSADMMSTDNDGIGLMARYTNSDNYYRFHWSQQADTWDKDFTKPGFQRRVLDVCVDGAWQVLASDNVPYTTGQWYNVEMRLVSDSIQVYIDGNLIFDVTDNSHDSGAVGLYSWGNSAGSYDNVGVYTQNVGPLGPDGPLNTGSFKVLVHVPADAAGLSDTVTITVTSILDPWVSETITLTTNVGRVHNIDQDIWYMDIQPAVDAANPGETLWANPSIYEEYVIVDKPLTIHGLDRDTTIVDGSEAGSGVTTNWLGYNDGYTENSIGIGGGDITMAIELTDIELAGYRSGSINELVVSVGSDDYGFFIANYDVWIQNFLPAYGDVYTGGVNVVYSGTSSGTGWDTIDIPDYAIPSTGSVFIGFTFWGSSEWPCGLDQSIAVPTPRANYCTFNGYGSWSDIGSFGFPGVWGIDVGVSSGGNAVFDVQADGVSIDGFTIQNGPVGILLTSASGCDIGDNIIQNCGRGISLQDSGLNYIHDNEISDNAGGALISESLETMFASNAGWDGNMFDLTPSQDILITGFDCNIDSLTDETVEIYYKSGTYLGSEFNPAAWTFLGSTVVTAQGDDNPTYVPIGDLALTSGQTYGLYITGTPGVGLEYTMAVTTFDDGTLQFQSGCGIGYPFGPAIFTMRTWNGRIHYSIPDSTGPGIMVQGSSSALFQDDFSVDTGAWTYSGNALRTGGYARLTQNSNGLVGQILYNQPIQTAFVAEFDYLAGQTGTDWVGYNDGYTENHLGLVGGGDITMAIELTDTELAAYRANDISELYVSIGSDADAFYVVNYDVWIETSLPAYGDVYTGGVNTVFSGTSSGTGWDTIDIPDYAIPDTGSVVIGINFMGTVGGDFPCGFDESNTGPTPRANYITYNGYGIWDDIGNLGWPGVWGFDVGILMPYDLNGADGFAMNFFKEAYTPVGGGYFGCVDADGTALGYSVEFDNFQNGGWDTSANHIAITQDNVWNHLASLNDLRSEDNAWHHARVIATNEGITVYVDDMNHPLLAWAGEIDMTYGGFSFTAGTGGLNNNHFVDNIHISFGNVIESNQVHNNEVGVLLWNTEGNQIFHNNFVNNGIHAIDNGDMNMWDGGYPTGGNYWSGFSGPDSFNGPLQNIPGADGMIDNPYIIDADSQDSYPLKRQYTTTGIVIDPIEVVEEPVVEPVADPGDGTITAVPAAQPSPSVVDPDIPDTAEQAALTPESDTTNIPEEATTLAPVQDVQNEPVQENVAATPSGSGNIYLLALLAISIIVMSMALFFRKRK